MSSDAPSLLTPVPAGPLPVIPPPSLGRPIEITIDGQSVAVPEGSTLLEACRSLGISTPTLCYLENLTPVNVCRICVVELEGSRVLVPACSRKAEPGMVVKTDSERVQLSRRLLLEFLASSVDVSTAPELQTYMEQYEARPERFGTAAPAAAAGVREAAQPGRSPAMRCNGRGHGCAAGQSGQRLVRPRLRQVHPLLQVRGGLRQGRAEHLRHRRRRARV